MSDSTFEAFRRAEALVSNGRPLDALRELRPVLDAEPDLPSVVQLAGRAYLNSAQFRRAEEAFSRLVEMDPSDHYSLFALGKTLQRQGRFSEAITKLRLAVAMSPLPEYQEALGEVSARLAFRHDPQAGD